MALSVTPMAEFVQIPEAAQFFGCGRTKIYQYIDHGDLHPVKHGKRTVLSVREMRRLAIRLATEAGVPTDVYETEGLDEAS